MAMSASCLLYVTFPSAEVAHTIGRMLIEKHLAACVNLLPAITSIYAWQGRIETASETAALIKTTAARAQDAQDAIIAAHPYDCPCVLKLDIAGGNPDFIAWIQAQAAPLTES